MKIKLRRFRKYLTEIRNLKAKVSELENQIEQSHEYHEEALSRASRRARATENERLEQERQAESDRWYREDQLKRATSDLERAVSYGDDYAIKRATEKIKKLDY